MYNVESLQKNDEVKLDLIQTYDNVFTLIPSEDVLEYGVSYNGKKWDITKRDEEGDISSQKFVYPSRISAVSFNAYYKTKCKKVTGMFTIYMVQKQDENKYTKRLKELGIKYSNIFKLSDEEQNDIVNTLEELLKKYPEAKDIIHVLWIERYDKEMGSYLMEMTQDGMYVSIVLDEGFFGEYYSKNNVRYILSHEFSHVLNAVLAFKISGIKLGKNDLKRSLDHFKVFDAISKKFCDGIMIENQITMTELEDYIGIYGLKSTPETFAEAFARKIYNNQDNIFINELVKKYNNLLYSENDNFGEKIMEECNI